MSERVRTNRQVEVMNSYMGNGDENGEFPFFLRHVHSLAEVDFALEGLAAVKSVKGETYRGQLELWIFTSTGDLLSTKVL